MSSPDGQGHEYGDDDQQAADVDRDPAWAFGQRTVIPLTRSLSIAAGTPADGRGGCGRMAELSPTASPAEADRRGASDRKG